MKKREDKQAVAPEDAVQKKDLNRVRETVRFIDPEQGPSGQGKKSDREKKK